MEKTRHNAGCWEWDGDTFWLVVANMLEILVYNSNEMYKSQILFNLTTALHVSDVTITHLQEHKTTDSTAFGNHYTVLLPAAIVEELEPV
jgi:hypothetical protein